MPSWTAISWSAPPPLSWAQHFHPFWLSTPKFVLSLSSGSRCRGAMSLRGRDAGPARSSRTSETVQCSLSDPDRGRSTSTEYSHSDRLGSETGSVRSRQQPAPGRSADPRISELIDQLVNHVPGLGNSVPRSVLDVQPRRPDHPTVGRVSVDLDVPSYI